MALKGIGVDEYLSAPDGARERLLAALREHALVIGEVTLSSGARASYYIDAKRAILRPDCFKALGQLLVGCAKRHGATAVGGVPISAIPVACAALAASGGAEGDIDKAFIVRKEPKQHGLGRSLDGPELAPGERCMLVEDVVTTGSSTIEMIKRLDEERIEIAVVVCVLDRLAGGAGAIGQATSAPYVALTTIDDVYPERPDR